MPGQSARGHPSRGAFSTGLADAQFGGPRAGFHTVASRRVNYNARAGALR